MALGRRALRLFRRVERKYFLTIRLQRSCSTAAGIVPRGTRCWQGAGGKAPLAGPGWMLPGGDRPATIPAR